MLSRGEIRDAKHAPGEPNMAGALTKYAAGNSIPHLSQFNRRAVRPAREIKGKFDTTAPGGQYLFVSAGSQEKENG